MSETRVHFEQKAFNWEHFNAAYRNSNRYLILYGGAGSGKSEIAAAKLIIRSLTGWRDTKWHKHRFIFLRKVRETIRDSQFLTLKDIIMRWGLSSLFSINETKMDITCINGSQLLSSGLDDPEKLKSIKDPTGTWIEEATEIDKEDLMQINLRMRGAGVTDYYQNVLTFNPKDPDHWLRKRFFV